MGVWVPALPKGEWVPSYCSASVMRMLGLYYGIDKSVHEWSDLCGTTPPQGFGAEIDGCDPKQLLQAGQKAGLTGSIIKESSLEELQHYLHQGIPPIVDWFTEDLLAEEEEDYFNVDGSDGHYSIVTDITDEHILLRDPRRQKPMRFKPKNFERVWFDFDGNSIEHDKANLDLRIAVILYPAGKLVAPYR